ncbi:FtsX-like permease family protein [Blautia stercoris]|uniref:FtsX-like permease family protein n=1 Tax=Blautia stercoris TaxID=871664 RepID=UPI00355C5D74
MFKLARRYIVFYKNQSFAILISMILSIALMAGISSLVYSGELSDLENSKEINGDWNYAIPLKDNTIDKITNKQDKGYEVEKYGICKTIDEAVSDKNIALLYGDKTYLEMTTQSVLEGEYPTKANEIAMSKFVLDNIGYDDVLGTKISLDGKDYVLSGVLKSEWAADSNILNAFISEEEVNIKKGISSFVYLKLDESKKMYKQCQALKEDLELDSEAIQENDNVNYYLGGESPQSFIDHLKFAFTNPEGNFTYLMLVLRDEFGLTVNGVILGLGLFSIFIIYSVFSVNISKRITQYGILKVLGIGKFKQFSLVLFELWSLLLIAFPIGAILGNLVAKLMYSNFNTVFINRDVVNSGTHTNETQSFLAAAELKAGNFHISYTAIVFEAAFLVVAMCFIAWKIKCQTQKSVSIQLLKGGNNKKRKNRTIYSKGKLSLFNVLIEKFMLERKRTFLGILVSLSLGGVIFLCSNFVLTNAQTSNQMQLASDDGLGSDYKIYENNIDLNKTLGEDVENNLEKIDGIKNIYPVKSYIGEVVIEQDNFFWKEYYEYLNEAYKDVYNRYMRNTTNGDYAIKSNILGYSDELLGKMEPYILEGSIDPDQMRRNNEVVLVTLEDAQGNHNSIDKKVGDTIKVKTPNKVSGSSEDLKQLGSESDFSEKEYTISAIVSRTMVRDSRLYTLEDQPDITYSVIMTNEQMKQNYNIEGYRVLTVEKEKNTDTELVANEIKKQTQALDDCLFQDYTGAIERQNEYLFQKTLFFYGIAFVFLIISLFHIANTMNHLILSRRHEYGILRAMGITNKNFRKLMLGQGALYGIFSSIVMILLYIIGNKTMEYLMGHVYGFLVSNIQVNVWLIITTVAVNICIGIFAVLIPIQSILKEDIIRQVNLT